jgi:hypothetical protein
MLLYEERDMNVMPPRRKAKDMCILIVGDDLYFAPILV